MARDKDKRWRCCECGHISLETELLVAPSPFDKEITLCGCPNCQAVAGAEFKELCDEPGCNETATCGFPAGEEFGGYRRTCMNHADWDEQVSL